MGWCLLLVQTARSFLAGLFLGDIPLETWHEMSKRHKEERRVLIEYCKAHKMTQKEAAAHMKVSVSGLNKYLKRNKINWHTGPRRKIRWAKPLAPEAM